MDLYRHFRHEKAAQAFAGLEAVVMGKRGTHLHGVLPTAEALAVTAAAAD